MASGVNTWLCTLLPDLQARGICVRACLFLHGGQPGPIVKQLFEAGISLDVVPSSYSFSEKANWLVTRMCEYHPKFLIPNYVIAGFAAGNNLRHFGVQTIAVSHGQDLFYQTLRQSCTGNDPQYRVSSAVCVSKALTEEWAASVAGRFPVRCIPCGVPMSQRFAERDGRTFRIVYVGRLAQEHKRVIDVAHALRNAVEAMPDVEADIIGDGPERPVVERIIAETFARARLRCLGYLPVETVRRMVADYHAVVLLSDSEGLPVTLLEAMTCGVVPICTDIRGGIRELVRDCVTGLIVKDRGPDVLRAIKLLKDDVGLWKRLSASVREIVLPYSGSRCADEWEKLIIHLNEKSETVFLTKPWVPPAGIELPPWNRVFHWDDDRKPFKFRVRDRIIGYKRRLLGQK